MKRALSIIVALAFLTSLPKAQDYSLYCPTITAIYGLCSEELVVNYLAHINDPYIPRPKAIPPAVIEVVKPTGLNQSRPDSDNSPTPYTLGTTPPAPKLVTYCYKDIANCTRCRKSDKDLVHYQQISIICPSVPWYEGKPWLVGIT